jgi:hypothetical protein
LPRFDTADSDSVDARAEAAGEKVAQLVDKHLKHRSAGDLVCRDELIAALSEIMKDSI